MSFGGCLVVYCWHDRILVTNVLRVLAPLVEESGDADARTSVRLVLELVPPTDLDGVLTALGKCHLFLGRWLAFMQRYPLVVMPTMGDLAPPYNLDTTREGQARVLDSMRVGFTYGRLRPSVQILAPRFREDLFLDAGEVIEAAEGVVTPIDPQPA